MNAFNEIIGIFWNSDIIYVTIKIIFATTCGALIGYDRNRFGKPAGIKTHSLVCLGSCLVMLVGILTTKQFGLGDPARIGAQVVSGIGFLGAGTILVTPDNKIQGLTSAAGLWFAACLGLVIGSSFSYMVLPSMVCFYLITHVLSRFDREI